MYNCVFYIVISCRILKVKPRNKNLCYCVIIFRKKLIVCIHKLTLANSGRRLLCGDIRGTLAVNAVSGLGERSAVLLAGGKSRRMGRDKLSLPQNGTTVLEAAIKRFSEIIRILKKIKTE